MTLSALATSPEIYIDTSHFQVASLDIWQQKYQLKDFDGNPIDKDIADTYVRVARALANLEKPAIRETIYKEFIWALENGAIPAGRILSNIGAQAFKPATSTINCTVSDTIPDSMDGILSKVHEAGLTLKAGCGIGYEFSTLRPSGAFVAGAGAMTSGPLSFMDIFDKLCFTVSSAGGRRGAQMGTMDVQHPDIMEFIKVKREDGRLRQFNLSVLITDEFMDAVINDKDWKLCFPVRTKEVEDGRINLETDEFVYRPWSTANPDDYVKTDDGIYTCKVYRTLKAKNMWDLIMNSTYDYAEPGFILIDQVNRMNNNWFCEDLRASNPCGEQMLPAYGACLLGSLNLSSFVENPFTKKAKFNFTKFAKAVRIFSRMLDNVVELNGLPLQQQRDEINRKRRHGMGYLGLGTAMTMLGLSYGDEESQEFTELVTKSLALEGWRAALDLAREKGPAPIFKEMFTITAKMLKDRPQLEKDGYSEGDEISGALLHVGYSTYMNKVTDELGAKFKKDAIKTGLRYTHATSLAPTGTISLSMGNNASNGVEPSFAHHYLRNIIKEGKKTKIQVDVCSAELLAYQKLVNPDAMPFSEDPENALPACFVDASSVTPMQHVLVQARAQLWIDSSISKTINVPTDIDYEEFKETYLHAYQEGLKGCTTFRFNPAVHSGVLVNEKDLSNTDYEFTLADGETVTVKGNQEIEYEGEMHVAANLFDALKEGYYGRF